MSKSITSASFRPWGMNKNGGRLFSDSFHGNTALWKDPQLKYPRNPNSQFDQQLATTNAPDPSQKSNSHHPKSDLPPLKNKKYKRCPKVSTNQATPRYPSSEIANVTHYSVLKLWKWCKKWCFERLKRILPEEGTTTNVIKRVNKMDEIIRAQIVLNLNKELSTFVANLLMSVAIKNLLWNNIQDSYQTETYNLNSAYVKRFILSSSAAKSIPRIIYES